MLIALKRPPRASRGATLRNFRGGLGAILATKRKPRAVFWEQFQPKVACWRQKSGRKHAFEKRRQKTSPKCPPETPQRSHFGCCLATLPPKRHPETERPETHQTQVCVCQNDIRGVPRDPSSLQKIPRDAFFPQGLKKLPKRAPKMPKMSPRMPPKAPKATKKGLLKAKKGFKIG